MPVRSGEATKPPAPKARAVRSRKPLHGPGMAAGRLIALLAFILASPLIILLALINKITSFHEPALFAQDRVGFAGAPVIVIKIRTMASGDRPKHERITPMGRFLRRSGLDELTQLWSLARGDLQWFGPRPYEAKYVSRAYVTQILSHTKPGFFSSSALARGIGTTKDQEAQKTWAEDARDLESWSFVYAFSLVFRTAVHILKSLAGELFHT